MSLLDRILRRDPQPEDDGWVDMTYGPGNPCPYESCHHNHETEGSPS